MRSEGHSGIYKNSPVKILFPISHLIGCKKGLTSCFPMAPASSTEYLNVLQHFTAGEVALVSAKKSITEFPETSSKGPSSSLACDLHYGSLAAFCCCSVSLPVPFPLPRHYISHRSFHSVVKQTSPKSHQLSAVSPRFRGWLPNEQRTQQHSFIPFPFQMEVSP